MPMKIHFLNVGHGDCTFIDLPSERLMMVDINNSKTLPVEDIVSLAKARDMSVYEFKAITASGRSWEDYYKSLLVDPCDYYKQHFAGRSIFRYVQTHPDMDHMSGLYRFFWQDEVDLENFWDSDHDKTFKEEDFFNCPYDWKDWLAYQVLRGGVGPGDSTHKEHRKTRGHTGDFWTPDGISILSPTVSLIADSNATGNYNNVSYVLKIDYGGRTVILPGDAEAAAWQSMLDYYPESSMRCDILKASHHGRRSGHHEAAVEAMDPKIVVCSVGKKPATDATGLYSQHGAQVLSTRYNGTLVATIWWDGEVWVDNAKRERVARLLPLAA